MSEIASFEDLIGGTEQTEPVTLTSGKIARVRGLSRYEYMLSSKVMADGSNDVAGFEVKIVSFGLVEPKLSEKQVTDWQKSPGALTDFQRVHEKIMVLSGVREGADKSSDQDVSD